MTTALGEMLPEEDILDLLQEMDSDGDGQINIEEFLSGMKQKVKEPESVKMLKEAFRVFDSQGSGSVTREFLRVSFLTAGAGPGGEQEVDEMLAVLDTDNDGNIEVEDFLRILLETPGEQEQEKETWCCIL